MASIYNGIGACVGFGEESTWGTAVSRTHWRPLISSSLTRTIEKVPRPTLQIGTTGAMRRKHYTSVDSAGGSFQIEGSYSCIGLLLKHLMGTVTKTGSDPYTHAYTIANDVPTGLTIENTRGTGTSEVFEGCRLNSGTIACSSGGVLTCEFDVIAETSGSTPRVASGSPTFGTDTPILHSHAGQMAFHGSNYDLIDMSLTVNNALATRQFLGSAVTAQPKRSDFQSVELSCSVEVDDVLYADLISDFEGDVSITFTNAAVSFTVEVQNAYLSAVSDPVSDAGIIKQSLTFVGQSDGTNEGCKLSVVNGFTDSISNG